MKNLQWFRDIFNGPYLANPFGSFGGIRGAMTEPSQGFHSQPHQIIPWTASVRRTLGGKPFTRSVHHVVLGSLKSIGVSTISYS